MNTVVDGVVGMDELSQIQQGPPDGACVNYERCGNVPAGNGMMCDDCLYEVRHKDEVPTGKP